MNILHLAVFILLPVFLFGNKMKGQPRQYPYCSSYGIESYSFDITVKQWDASNGKTFSIGNFCSIAPGLTLYLDGNHRVDWISTYPFMSFYASGYPEARFIEGHCSSKGNITIGNDVWIGENVTILSGVTIGDGAVIGAHSVVAKNVPAYAIFAGNPARFIRYRFDQEIIEALLEIRWWDWPLEKIRQNVHLLCSSNIEEFIQQYSR